MDRDILITKDSKGKIRVVEMQMEWQEKAKGFVIERRTYQYGGKITEQPDLVIQKGKVKRTVTEQAKLEYNSHRKKYLDKGYKELKGEIGDYTKEQLDELLPEEKTDANGFKKHMLAKDSNKVATSAFDKVEYYWASWKLDGVRNSFLKRDGIHSASRGGGDYDFSTTLIRNHPKLIKFFEDNPDIILDGELYVHGRPLQWISGAARMEKDAVKCDELEFWVYDIMDSSLTAEERIFLLDDLAEEYGFVRDYETVFGEGELRIRVIPHEKVGGWANIKKLHDKYVSEGFEGLIIRHPNKPYGFGKRTNDMIKVKEYQDDEFEIIGYSDGLRAEDFVFNCITKDGKEFEAKPMGTREVKYEYLERMPELIGKTATVKFFNYTEEGKPAQPVLKCIRDYD